jgi:hypothetical protein
MLFRRAPLLLLTLLAACASGPERRLAADLAFLADDERMGREAGTPGYDAAADYAVRRLEEAGLRPTAGGWRQTVPLRAARRRLDRQSLALTDGARRTDLDPAADFMIAHAYARTEIDVEAPVVYAAYGVSAPEKGVDDYAGLDVRGKIVAMFSGAPASLDTEERAYYASAEVKRAAAVRRGAVGLIVLSTEKQLANDGWARRLAGAGRAGMVALKPDGSPDIAANLSAVATLSGSGADKLFAGEAVDAATLRKKEAEGKPPPGFALTKRARIAGAFEHAESQCDNVIGLIEGTDPTRRNEIILILAHLDHIGVDPDAKPGADAINNGALDNAAGVAAMLEAARALSASEPARTIGFAAVCAEEKGLVGSRYLARRSPFGDKRVVGVVNLDMPLVLYPFTDVIAFGAERSSIGPAVAAAARSLDLALAADPRPEDNVFIRSDHYSFVKQGVPAVFLVTGPSNGGREAFAEFLKTHYHRPTDDLSLPIDYDSLARFAALNAAIAEALADAPAAPAWNPGDFFGETFAK